MALFPKSAVAGLVLTLTAPAALAQQSPPAAPAPAQAAPAPAPAPATPPTPAAPENDPAVAVYTVSEINVHVGAIRRDGEKSREARADRAIPQLPVVYE